MIDIAFKVIAGIGFVIAVIKLIFDIRNRKLMKPTWYYHTKRIIGIEKDVPGDIEIHFRGKPVPQVSLTTIGFINLGKEPIRYADDVRDLKAVFSNDVVILKKPEVKPSKDAIKFSAELEGKDILLSFDFLNHMDGAIVEIFHTGDENSAIEVHGTIVGAEKGIEQGYNDTFTADKRKSLGDFLVVASLFLFFLGILIWGLVSNIHYTLSTDGILMTVFLFGTTIFLGYWTIQAWRTYRKGLPDWLRPGN